MALGRTHELINLVFLPPALYFIPKEFYLPFTAGYLVGTFVLSPDIDMAHSKPSKRWKALKPIWRPYQSFSKHRGISHLPVIGSLIRLFYLGAALVFIYFVALGVVSLLKPEFVNTLLEINPLNFFHELAWREESAFFIFGVVLADITHIVIDFISSLLKKRPI